MSFTYHEEQFTRAAEFISELRLSNPRWSDWYPTGKSDISWRRNWYFRGHGDAGWDLRPNAWRTEVPQILMLSKNAIGFKDQSRFLELAMQGYYKSVYQVGAWTQEWNRIKVLSCKDSLSS